MFIKTLVGPKPYLKLQRICTDHVIQRHLSATPNEKFETVFKFPFVKYISAFNRLKVYHLFGTAISIPSTGILEMLNIVPQNICLTTSIIGISGALLLSAGTLPFNNSIGFIYIKEDNSKIRISSVDFWGKRNDRVIPTEDWIPLLDMNPKFTDAFFLTPHLADGTKYKLFVKYGQVLNAQKIGQVLE